MKKLLLKSIIILSAFLIPLVGYAKDEITFKWKGSQSGREIHLGGPNKRTFTINWGNGKTEEITTTASFLAPGGLVVPSTCVTVKSPQYVDEKEYTVTIMGKTSVAFIECFMVDEYDDCGIYEIDLTNATRLAALAVPNCSLSGLDLSKNTKLSYIDCNKNNLSSLDISKMTLLRRLSCNNNKLESLTMPSSPMLYTFDCDGNMLTLSELYKAYAKIEQDKLVAVSLESDYQEFPEENLVEGESVNLSSQAKFGQTNTIFTVKKDGAPAELDDDYTIENGVIKFLQMGNFAVEMSNDEVFKFSGSWGFYPVVTAYYNVSSATSIENEKDMDFRVYFDSTSSRVYMHSEDAGMEVFIYNLNGQVVLQTLYTIDGIDLSGLSNGTYLLKANNMKNTRHAKFIKR